MSKYSFIIVLHYTWLYHFSFEKKHIENAQITFTFAFMSTQYLHYYVIVVKLILILCTYVYQVILDVSLIFSGNAVL